MSDLIERLRKLRDCAEETDDAEIVDDDPRCVFVPMLPEDFDALLREAADALEAARADAGRGAMVTMALRAAVTALAHASASDPVYTSVYQHTSEALHYYAIDAAMAAEGRD